MRVTRFLATGRLPLVTGIHNGVHEHHGVRPRNRIGVFGRELLADERAHAGQIQLLNRFHHARADAVVAAQRVAVADDQKITAGGQRRIVAHV